MVRLLMSLAIFGASSLVTGCLGDANVARPPDAARPLMPPYCFFAFDYSLHGMVRGGKTLLAVYATPQPDWLITVADPQIATARFTDSKLEITALASGTTSLVVRACGRDTPYFFTVVPAAKIEVRVTQTLGGRSNPVTRVTAMTGSTDVLEVTYLDAHGNVLTGQGAASYAYEAGVSPGDHMIAPLPFPVEGIAREYPLLSFAAAGRVIASGDFGVVPIEVSVTPQPERIFVLVFPFSPHIVGVAGDNGSEPIAGVTASWTIEPSDQFTFGGPVTAVRELGFGAKPGTTPTVPAVITARVGSLTATTTFGP